jgi:hypothetical protein
MLNDRKYASEIFIDENGGGPGVRLRKRQLKERLIAREFRTSETAQSSQRATWPPSGDVRLRPMRWSFLRMTNEPNDDKCTVRRVQDSR